MGKTISHTTSSTSYQLGQRPAENRAIGHQSEASPRDVPDVKGGLMKDSMDLILRLFEGIDLAAEEHRAVDSARAVLPHQKRYNLWTIGNSNLDSRLVGNPAVRARVVSILTNLVSVLSPGNAPFHAANCSAANVWFRYTIFQVAEPAGFTPRCSTSL